MKDNLSVDGYVLKMKNIADNNLFLYILGGLGSDYESFVVNLTSRFDDLLLLEIQCSLQLQEMRPKTLNSVYASDPFVAPTENLPFCGR